MSDCPGSWLHMRTKACSKGAGTLPPPNSWRMQELSELHLGGSQLHPAVHTLLKSKTGVHDIEVQQCEPGLAAICRARLQMAQDLLQSLCSVNSLSSHSAILSFIKVCSRHAQTTC